MKNTLDILEEKYIALKKEIFEEIKSAVMLLLKENNGNLIVFKDVVYYTFLNENEFEDLRRISYSKKDNQIYLHIIRVKEEIDLGDEYTESLDDATITSLWEILNALNDDTPIKIETDETI